MGMKTESTMRHSYTFPVRAGIKPDNSEGSSACGAVGTRALLVGYNGAAT